MPHIGDYQPVQIPGMWVAPTLLNSWVNLGSPYAPAGYCRDQNGITRLKGILKLGVVGSAMFNLPVGFRPPTDMILPVASNSAFGMVVILATGDVVANIGSDAWFSIDGVSFRTTV